jgi:hypothetical protein
MGCYPIFGCNDWSQLRADLDDISQGLISLALVTDPFGNYDVSFLQEIFKDVVIPFKKHFVVDLSYPLNQVISRHHRYYAHKSLKRIKVEVCEDPNRFIQDWLTLYAALIKRHNIKGISKFSYSAFAKQFNVPGITMLRVVYENVTIGAQLWYIQNDIGYSHLTAFSDVAYKLRASYGLYLTATKYFSEKLRWLNLGGGAGLTTDGSDGLSIFKRGWASCQKTVYFCGRIFNQQKYAEIVKLMNVNDQNYFPAYRTGEFT